MQLLVEWAVGIGLDSTEAGCTPTYLHHLLQLLIVCVEVGIQHEWIACERAANIVDRQCLALRHNVQLDIAERTPVERGELLTILTTGEQLVPTPHEELTFHLIAITFLIATLICIERFSIANIDFCIFSLAEVQLKETISKFLLVKQ